MSDNNFAPVHHQTTSGMSGHHTTGAHNLDNYSTTGTNTGIDTTTAGASHDYARSSAVNDTDRSEFPGRLGDRNDDTISPAAEPISRDRLNSEYEPRTEITQQRGSLASTEGPFRAPTTEDATSSSDVPPASTVSQQNAPHQGGRIGEATMSAFGYGGSTVERPKEHQGTAEKILNFLGA